LEKQLTRQKEFFIKNFIFKKEYEKEAVTIILLDISANVHTFASSAGAI
jgi:hypothetical protein